MAKHLTQRDIDKILSILDGWENKLSWDELCDAAVIHVGKRPTRQSLSSNKQIKEAFGDKKKRLKNVSQELKTPSSLTIAAQRIKRLEEQNVRLKNENHRLLEQYVVWQYNAYKYGMDKRKLNEPLPKVDRK
jgi:hypothetical protein